MATERLVSAQTTSPTEEKLNFALRPTTLDGFVGQPKLIEKISITLEAVQQRGEPMEHVLLHGPPGLGKTTLSHVIANEMGTHLTVTAGPALTKAGDLVGILTKLQPRDVLFIDEVHRLPVALEEYLYSAMEDFKIDVQIDQGMHAKTITLPVAPFTLIGATTRAGLLSGPMRSRFGLVHNLEFYGKPDLYTILQRNAGLLNMPGSDEGDDTALAKDLRNGLDLISDRSRGTPRIANRLLRRVRDYIQTRAGNQPTPEAIEAALLLQGIDPMGLDDLDRKYLTTIGTVYEGGPVGLEAVAATMGEDSGTLEDMVEPFLLQLGYVARTRRGRQLTQAGAQHVGLKISPAKETERFPEAE